jgi:hypothetical protein
VDALSSSQAKKVPFLWRGDEQSLRKLIGIKSGHELRHNLFDSTPIQFGDEH